jgi:hypothetical protein
LRAFGQACPVVSECSTRSAAAVACDGESPSGYAGGCPFSPLLPHGLSRRLVTLHRADVVDGATVRQLPRVAARPAALSPIVEQMLERLRLLWRGTAQTGGHGSPERQHDERRVTIDHGLVTAKIVLGDTVLQVKAGAFFAQSRQDRRVPAAEQFHLGQARHAAEPVAPYPPHSCMAFPFVVSELRASSTARCPTIYVTAEGLGDRARRGESTTPMGEWSM